jgi:hypothetical protein
MTQRRVAGQAAVACMHASIGEKKETTVACARSDCVGCTARASLGCILAVTFWFFQRQPPCMPSSHVACSCSCSWGTSRIRQADISKRCRRVRWAELVRAAPPLPPQLAAETWRWNGVLLAGIRCLIKPRDLTDRQVGSSLPLVSGAGATCN